MTLQKFKQEYEKLNPGQKEAVDTIDGPVMVIAGPGTGKTTILSLRIANILIKTDTPPSGILALTFTESGVKAMRSKLREIIGETALGVAIHTFHGFAASVIAEFGDHFAHLSRSKQITDVESERILRDILKEKKFWKLRPLGDPDFYISKIIGAISDAKREAWTPEMIKSFAESEIERIKNDPASISSRGQSKGEMKGEALRQIEKSERTILFSQVYESYENKKREEKKNDFDDLIFELLQVLKQDKLLLQILQERFLYILLDEHQDTSDSQNLIVRRLADFFESPNLFVVGDEKQAIYRFQGASVENFLSFQKIWSGMKVISLTQNYRSHQNILDASFQMIEKNYGEKEYENLRIKLKSGSPEEKNPLDLVIAPNKETEEIYLTEKLKEIVKKDKTKKIAVIVRKNSDVARIFSLLEKAGVPASAERGANIFAHPAGALFFSLLEFIFDPGNLEALAETFAYGLWNLDFEKQVEFIKLARGGEVAKIGKEIPAISKLQKEISETDAMEFIYLAADLSGFKERISESPLSTEVWRGIVALAEDLTRNNNIENPKILIEEMLSYRKTAERKTIKINTSEVLSPVTIMTAHGSKGLEFDFVFLPYATEETWIRKNHGSYFALPREKETDDETRDERRLFYVAITRARKHVVISRHEEDDLGKAQTPLRFVDELDQKLISTTTLAKTTKINESQTIEKIKSKKDLEKIEYAKRVLLEKGLSVTSLNHFLECPSKFFYKSILKVPEAPTASSEKGTAMHEAIANVWKELGKKETKHTVPALGQKDKALGTAVLFLSSVITESVKNCMQRSFLPLREKEAVLDELIASAPKVAECLQDHFAQTGNVLAESWVETNFIDSTNKIEINLHGKLDAIVDQQDKTLVFDYKTREAMSVNAIKGETAASDGNYFRQLIFYKILLAENFKFKNKIIEPALVFVKPDKKGKCPTVFVPLEKEDEMRVKAEINSLLQSVWSGEILTATCSDENCQYCGWKKIL